MSRSTFNQLKFSAQFIATHEKYRAAETTSKTAPDRDTKVDAFVRSYFDLAVTAGVDRSPWFIAYEMATNFKTVPPEIARRLITAEIAAARKRAAR